MSRQIESWKVARFISMVVSLPGAFIYYVLGRAATELLMVPTLGAIFYAVMVFFILVIVLGLVEIFLDE